METIHSIDHGDHHAMADGDHQHSFARITANGSRDDDDTLSIPIKHNARRQSCPEPGSIKVEKCVARQAQQRFETLMMTGDFFIKFNGKTTHHSPVLLKNNRIHNISFGHCSTPASPEESEHKSRIRAARETSPFSSPVTDKKSHFSYSGVYVRTSKSEDHLQKASLTTVNIDIEDEMASSLNTLLDTKQDNPNYDRVTWTCTTAVPSSGRAEDSPPPLSPSPPPESLSSSSGEIISPTNPESEKSSSTHSGYDKSEHYTRTSISESFTSESTTIRKDLEREDSSEGECTSDLVSTISSCEEIEQLSDSDQESLKNNHFCDDSENKPALNKDKRCEHHSELPETFLSIRKSVSEGINIIVSDEFGNTQTNIQNNQKHSDMPNGELTLSQYMETFEWPDHLDRSIGSTTSYGSESTLDEVPYEELMESHDEDSFVLEDESTKSVSPTTTDDESDIESLHSFHYSPKAVDMPSAIRLAKRLYNLEGFKKHDVSRHLSKNNEFSRVVAEEYLKYFDFTSDLLDVALRKFLKKFCLIGETQERERVLLHFSKRYLDCNPGTYRSQDAAHTLTCALMLLNTDLHGENVAHKMTCGEFIENLSELNDGENFPRDILKSLYYSIKTVPLQWATEEEEKPKAQECHHAISAQNNRQSLVGQNPFLEVPNPNSATEYKKGYVMRKCCVDPNGKKTPLGKRGWKMVYATLRDLVLYLHKDDHGFKKNQLYDSLHNSIRIHHSLATKASDYKKKQHVFRFQTADQAEYLFQTSDSKELQSWVDTLNLVAASLSAPPLASAVGSQKKFQRPLLPVSHTKLNLREQLQDHENRVVWLQKELDDHQSHAPEKGSRSRFLHEYAEKEAYLQYELKRYRTYAFLLRSKMSQYPELEPSLVETSIGEVDEPAEKVEQTVSTSSPVHRKKSHTPVTRSYSDRCTYHSGVLRNSIEEC